MISTFTAFFDSNVFFGARLRSLLLAQAQTGLFRARWSEDVHAEWMRAVVRSRPDLTLADLQETRAAMDRAVLDCLVADYRPLIATLQLPDPDDRHILAAAIAGRASVIVTFNERHFPEESLAPFGLHTRHPDAFLLDLESIDGAAFLDAVRWDLGHYRNPPVSVDDYVGRLRAAGVPKTADKLVGLRILLT